MSGQGTVVAMIDDYCPRLPCALEPCRAATWQQLIRDQHGLLDTDQLRLLDIGPGVITANLEAQRWRRVLPRVYATFTGPLIREARITGALLYGGPTAVLRHTTATQVASGTPVSLAGDGICATIGEHWVGAGRGVRHMLRIVVSSGIGSGLVLDDRARVGPTGNAGQLGHLVVDPDGPQCPCGGRGCVELIGSGPVRAPGPRRARSARRRRRADRGRRTPAPSIQLPDGTPQWLELAHDASGSSRRDARLISPTRPTREVGHSPCTGPTRRPRAGWKTGTTTRRPLAVPAQLRRHLVAPRGSARLA
ncbi:MAG TPA: ROK family protein [Pseudonocardiaceae bacterium]|nr:ROK family protein [Pseudonocardiaceae bacterium]